MRNRGSAPIAALRLTARWKNTFIDSALITGPRPISIGGFGAGRELQVDVPELLEGPLGALGLDSAEIRVPAAAKEIVGESEVVPGQSVRLGVGDRLSFTVRQVTVEMRMEAAERVAPRARWALPDGAIVRSFGFTALLHVAFVFMTGFARPVPSLDPSMILRTCRLKIMARQLKPEVQKPIARKSSAGGLSVPGTPGKMAGPKGRAIQPMGKKDVREFGLLKILNDAKGATGSIFDRSGLKGLNASLSEVRGTALAGGFEGGGFASHGSGTGGEGRGLAIGFGGAGKGYSCAGPEGCEGEAMLAGRGKATAVPRGPTTVLGGLTRDDVSSVIRKNHPRFRFCYERELNANPNIAGKVSIEFKIAPNGAVATAEVRESTVGDTAVSECVAKVMRTLQFKQPKGGGVVIVTYPFVFTTSG